MVGLSLAQLPQVPRLERVAACHGRHIVAEDDRRAGCLAVAQDMLCSLAQHGLHVVAG